METKTTMRKIISVRASAVPGDTLRMLTRDVRCTDGTLLRAGTTYQPAYAGDAGQTISVVRAK